MMWIDEICRLCAQISEVLYPIFDKTGERPHLDVKIRKCLSLDISTEDLKPKQVCYNCAAKLDDFYDFVEQSQSNDYKYETVIFAPPASTPPQHDSVIVIGKSEDNRECGDILLLSMVELKNLEGLEEEEDAGVERNAPVVPEKRKPFECSDCPKSFMRRSSLNAHMSTHTQIRPYSCAQCDRKFAVRWNLTIHERIHSGVFSCEFCGKNFPVKGKLERHVRTHTGERPFGCSLCEKAFSDKRNLEAHLRTHSEERPFVCGVCGKAFRSRSHLSDHRRVHSPDAPFTCDSCGKSFKWKTNLTIHLRSHTGEKTPCPDCGKLFSRTSLMTKHRRVHHLQLL